VCEWRTVAVDELLLIELYSYLMHLVSDIKGSLKSDCNAVDLIRSMLSGSTITSCPKVRCMEIIEELKPTRRGLFCGSCGYLDANNGKPSFSTGSAIHCLLLTLGFCFFS
jgi:para-aminobenzoate synthetase component 1